MLPPSLNFALYMGFSSSQFRFLHGILILTFAVATAPSPTTTSSSSRTTTAPSPPPPRSAAPKHLASGANIQVIALMVPCTSPHRSASDNVQVVTDDVGSISMFAASNHHASVESAAVALSSASDDGHITSAAATSAPLLDENGSALEHLSPNIVCAYTSSPSAAAGSLASATSIKFYEEAAMGEENEAYERFWDAELNVVHVGRDLRSLMVAMPDLVMNPQAATHVLETRTGNRQGADPEQLCEKSERARQGCAPSSGVSGSQKYEEGLEGVDLQGVELGDPELLQEC